LPQLRSGTHFTMDSPSLVNLPVEIVFLIAGHLDKRKEVRSLMQVYLISKFPSPDTTRRFREIMVRAESDNLTSSNRHLSGRLCASCWAISTGDVQLARLALADPKVATCRALSRPVPDSHPYDSSPDERDAVYRDQDYFPPPFNVLDPEPTHFNTRPPVTHNLPRIRIPASRLGVDAPLPGHVCKPTPVMLAVLSGNLKMLKFVLDEVQTYRSGLVSKLDKLRRTKLRVRYPDWELSALHLAVHLSHFDIVRVLAEAGARVHWSLEPVGNVIMDPFHPRPTRYRNRPPPPPPPKPCIFAAIFGWGTRGRLPQEQQSQRLEILRYFLDKGNSANSLDHRPARMLGEWLCKMNRLPTQFSPLWYAVWGLEAGLPPDALLLIRRGAYWAPWTAWEDAPWERARIRPPGRTPHRHMSPLEWVALGAQCHSCRFHQREPDSDRLGVEQALFKAMMEEGVEPPTSSDELQSALEVVVFAHFTRGFHDHPLLSSLCEERVRYLVGKGARLEDLDVEFTKAATRLAGTWGPDLAGRLGGVPVEEGSGGTLKEKTRGRKKRARR